MRHLILSEHIYYLSKIKEIKNLPLQKKKVKYHIINIINNLYQTRYVGEFVSLNI